MQESPECDTEMNTSTQRMFMSLQQARIQTVATDACASVQIFTRTRIVNILLKYI